jgi:hypothetical protein
MVATGLLVAVTRFVGRTCKVEGIAPKEHINVAPATTSCGMEFPVLVVLPEAYKDYERAVSQLATVIVTSRVSWPSNQSTTRSRTRKTRFKNPADASSPPFKREASRFLRYRVSTKEAT